MGKKLILHITTSLFMGGAPNALYNILKNGLYKSCDNVVLCLREEGPFGDFIRSQEVPVYSLNMNSGAPRLKDVRALRNFTKNFSPNIIQGWMYHGNLASSLARRFVPGAPKVAWNIRQSFYGMEHEKRFTRQVIHASRWLSFGVDALVYNSQISREQHEAFGFSRTRGQVIPNGFDLRRFARDRATGDAVRQELGLPQDALVVGHVARFHPMKNHMSFLNAAVEVARQVPTARFLLLGRGVSPENPVLAGIVTPDVAEKFVFAGERDDSSRLMQAMDVLASSSAWGEAFPNVLGEAMACGLPCVATDVGDSSDIISKTGIIVPRSNNEALANGLLDMLRKSKQELRALGDAARERVETHYGIEPVVAQYAELYDKLVNWEGR